MTKIKLLEQAAALITERSASKPVTPELQVLRLLQEVLEALCGEAPAVSRARKPARKKSLKTIPSSEPAATVTGGE